jgi:hypothetical protein
MAKKIPARSGLQWKVIQGLHINHVEHACEEWTGKGWTVFAILGPFGNVAIVLNRMVTL